MKATVDVIVAFFGSNPVGYDAYVLKVRKCSAV